MVYILLETFGFIPSTLSSSAPGSFNYYDLPFLLPSFTLTFFVASSFSLLTLLALAPTQDFQNPHGFRLPVFIPLLFMLLQRRLHLVPSPVSLQ